MLLKEATAEGAVVVIDVNDNHTATMNPFLEAQRCSLKLQAMTRRAKPISWEATLQELAQLGH